jgi:excisionase family DNA binding protein
MGGIFFMEKQSNFLTTSEVANLTGLKSGTLEVWRVYGKGPQFVKFGRAVRYRKADILAWIDGQVRQSTSQMEAV